VHVVTRLRARLRSERGFTVVETVVAAAVGSVVMLAIFFLLDTSVKQSSGVNARVDSTQRGRAAMESITRELRSQVCFAFPSTAPPVSLTAASDYSVTFYGFSGSGTFVPSRRTIWWDTNTNSIKESVEPGVPAAGPVTSFGTAQTRTILTDVKPPLKPAPAPPNTSDVVFSYQRTDGTALGATPLSATDLGRVGRIVVRFNTTPATKGSSTQTTSFESQVFVRTADPNGLGGSTDPDCS
jgi:hypothetical protein